MKKTAAMWSFFLKLVSNNFSGRENVLPQCHKSTKSFLCDILITELYAFLTLWQKNFEVSHEN
jgi:hypothetical protein